MWNTRCFLPSIVIVFPTLSTEATVPWKGSPRPLNSVAPACGERAGEFVAAVRGVTVKQSAIRKRAVYLIYVSRLRTSRPSVRLASSFRNPQRCVGRRERNALVEAIQKDHLNQEACEAKLDCGSAIIWAWCPV